MPLADSRVLAARLQGVVKDDSILAALSYVIGRGRKLERVSRGIYLIPHFSMDLLIWGKNNWEQDDPKVEGLESSSGVCDSVEQFKQDVVPLLEKHPEHLIVSMTHIDKKTQPADGGWRWRKWGPYIGKGTPTHEYLGEEPGFENGVYVYHIYILRLAETCVVFDDNVKVDSREGGGKTDV